METKDNFKEILNQYLKQLNCTGKELAQKSSLSESLISRFKNGQKIPKKDSEQIEKLITGIISLANEKNINISKKEVEEKFNQILSFEINYENLIKKFNLLIDTLNINISNLSRYLGYDPSYISKIRTGQRKPNYINYFIISICKYIEKTYNDNESYNKLLSLMNLSKIDSLEYELKTWLCAKDIINDHNDKIKHFINELNDFNLDDYIKTIHFDKLKVPSIPIKFLKSKNYYGIYEMRQGELDFFKYTILSKSTKNLFMYSNMPMEDLSKDIDFGKKWMLSVAMLLKKGVHLNIIHDLNRSFNELMLGLECWIPIYMTGQVTPYYFKNYNNKIYSQLNYVSDNYALIGECIVGHHDKGKYYLTSNNKEIKYYKEQSNLLLKYSSSLMDIYTKKNIDSLKMFLKKDALIEGDRKRILSELPVHTISNELLNKIALNNNLSEEQIKKLKNYINESKEYIKKITDKNILVDEIFLLNEEDFNKYNIKFSINNLNFKYTYDNYLEHFNDTQKYKNKNYILHVNDKITFTNINIYINSQKYVLISKKNNPNIHFLIHHKKLVDAIENFIPLV